MSDAWSDRTTTYRAEFAGALLAQALGAAVVLLVATRDWQTLTTPRSRPFADVVLAVSGRTIDAAPTAFALVALAGVVAVLATKGVVRRVIGALVSLSGAAIGWRCASASAALGPARARELAVARDPRITTTEALGVQVHTQPVWGGLAVLGGVLILSAGLAIMLRGGRWAGMSVRYERGAESRAQRGAESRAQRGAAPGRDANHDAQQVRARADASLWTALERGEDPTSRDPRDAE